jgi:hypothetical protein
LVLAPQMKKVANRIQNTGNFEASRSVPSAAATIGTLLGDGAGSGCVPASPNGLRPTSLGRSRMTSKTANAATPSMAQTSASAIRQPNRSVRLASSGRNTNCPVATLAVRMPTTSPRRAANHRVATVAPSTSAVMPVPIPIKTPHSSIRCQTFVMASEASSAKTTINCAVSVTLRRP